MNATAYQRVSYSTWLKWLTTRAEFPVAHGNRHGADARARRTQAAREVDVKLSREMEYEHG